MILEPGGGVAERRLASLAEIDRRAEAARLRWITPGAGQAMEYKATEEEAERYVAAAPAVRAGGAWPWLGAERAAQVGAATGAPTLLAVAQEVLSQRDQWVQVGCAIKTLRRAAKRAVEAATTPAAIRQVLAGLAYPLPPND